MCIDQVLYVQKKVLSFHSRFCHLMLVTRCVIVRLHALFEMCSCQSRKMTLCCTFHCVRVRATACTGPVCAKHSFNFSNLACRSHVNSFFKDVQKNVSDLPRRRGLDLRGAVIIVDEAHNLLEAINGVRILRSRLAALRHLSLRESFFFSAEVRRSCSA